MLTVAPLASGQAKYYLSLAGTAAGYYVDEKGVEPAGVWYGACAREFGLEGVVQAEHLSRLCEGFDPHDPGGKKLVRNAGTEKRAHGTDLCFSAPKSVSVAWALASPELREAMEKAMHRAVRDALDYIQDTCGFARVGAQGQRLERVPLMWARFEHSSSRAGDVQWHFHAVCPNVTRHADGRTTAIDPTGFYFHMMSGGAIFRASLAEGLRNLGFEIERDKACFRLKGIPEELCERTSTRRAEILEAIFEKCKTLGRLGGLSEEEILKSTSGRMAELINLETRRAKRERSRADVFEETRAVARELGLSDNLVEEALAAARKLTPEEKALVKEELFRSTIEKLAEQHSHWNERDLTQVVAQEAQGRGLNGREVRELVHEKLASEELVRLGELITEAKNERRGSWRERSEERFTTREILVQEAQLLGAVERMSRKSAAVKLPTVKAVIEQTRKKLAAEGKKLSVEQAKAIAQLTAGRGLVACLKGKAGTTKSTVLGACRVAWELSGKTVIGCAVAGVAKDALQESSGIKSDTLAMTLMRLRHDRLTLTPKHVVVLDEAGMVPTTALAELVHHVERAGAKFVAAGDQGQIQAIGRGGPFGSICERHPKQVAELTEIHRQREPWRKETVRQFSRGEAREALISYAAHEQLHVTTTRDEAIWKLVELWKAGKGHLREHAKDTFILAPLNCEVNALNELCQKERLAAGQLGDKAMKIGKREFFVGDRVLLTKRAVKFGVENGFMGEVVAFNERAQVITVRLDKGGRKVALPVETYGAEHIRLGYSATVHKSQGSTREVVHVLLGSHMMDQHLAYVAASRSKGETHLVCDYAEVAKDPTLMDAIRTLARPMSRDRTKDLAHDILSPPARQAPAPERDRHEPHQRLTLSLGL